MKKTMHDDYIRWAKIVRIIDGDTFEADIDLGFDLTFRKVIRMYGINAPEMHGEDRIKGIASKAWLEGQLEGQYVYLETIKVSDKYGRYVANVYHLGETDTVNKSMVASGFAVEAKYG
jgi:micrococcal nuclease